MVPISVNRTDIQYNKCTRAVESFTLALPTRMYVAMKLIRAHRDKPVPLLATYLHQNGFH